MVSRRCVLVMTLIIVLAFAGCQSAAPGQSTAQNGLMDLSGWDFAAQGNVSLGGSWAFYWDELISPGHFTDAKPTGYMSLPSYWTEYAGLGSYGRATYRLDVKTDGAVRLYGLKVPEIYTEYALWVNGELLDANGSFANSEPVYLHPRTYEFYSEASDIELLLQVKNTAHVYGGVGQSLRLGTSAQIRGEASLGASVDLILISVSLFSAFYYLILYIFRRKSRELVWFAVLCVSVALRSLLSNATLIMQVFPAMPFWLGSKLVTASIPMIVIAMLYFTRELYVGGIPLIPFKALLIINAAYLLLIAAAPSGIYSFVFTPYLLTVGAACALGIWLSTKAAACRKRDAVFFLAGMLLLASGALIDTLIYLRAIAMSYVLPLTLFGFIVLQVVLLAKRYAEAFRHTERLTGELQTSLNKLNNTETAFMSAQMKPHFLYNALTTIAERCETDAKEAGRLIISLSKYLRRTLDYDNLSGIVPLKKELELVHAYTSIEIARFADIEVAFALPEPLPAVHLPPLTLQPLVENAIKHGLRKRKGGGRVTVSAASHGDSMVFCVEDDGIGIPEDVLKGLVTEPRGRSIGLYNINARLMRLYGKGLDISSQSGTGTRVSFEIPYRKDD